MNYLKKSISKFIFFGLLNTILSNLLLLLLLKLLPISISTFISQICHAISAYLFGMVKIFKKYGNPFRFALLVIFSWTFQWQIIKTLNDIGFDNFQSVMIVIPVLAIISYLIQKVFIFK